MVCVTTPFLPTAPPARPSGNDLLDSHVERLGHELALVERQLAGYSRRLGAYAGHRVLETIGPAVGRYRDDLVAERERILTRIGMLTALRIAASA